MGQLPEADLRSQFWSGPGSNHTFSPRIIQGNWRSENLYLKSLRWRRMCRKRRRVVFNPCPFSTNPRPVLHAPTQFLQAPVSASTGWIDMISPPLDAPWSGDSRYDLCLSLYGLVMAQNLDFSAIFQSHNILFKLCFATYYWKFRCMNRHSLGWTTLPTSEYLQYEVQKA